MRLGWIISSLVFVVGCGAGAVSRDQIDRSLRELELAAGLREEGRIVGALEHLHRALELDKGNAEAHLLLGFIKMERQDYAEAEKHLKTGTKLLEKQDRIGSTLAEARNMYGLCLIGLGRFDEAIASLTASANDGMNTAPHLAWGNLGLAQLRSEKYDDAIESLGEATRLQPRFCVGHYRLGQALVAKQRWGEAEAALVKAIQADEQCHASIHLQGAWRLRGEVRTKLGHKDDALDDLERCVELAPRSEDGQACQQALIGLK